MTGKPTIFICSICHKPIPAKGRWLEGNNAEPINSGRCCDECDRTVVIPERIRLMRERDE